MHLTRDSCIFIHPMSIRAYAKINIGLNILGKREDGFHNLETVFHLVNIYDELDLQPSSTIILKCDSTDVPPDETNLCLRAAQTIAGECHTIRGVQITLTKRIPVGAGLGGGSSDAAATLTGLNTFWNLNLSGQRLHEYALRLGSDVPYFLHRQSALATGRGDVLEYFPLDVGFWILIVAPGIQVSTPWAYRQLQPSDAPKIRLTKNLLLDSLEHPEKLSHSITNDFEQPVFHHHPELRKIKESILDEGAVFALMSGSGSAIYGFFTDPATIRAAASKLGKHFRTYLTPPHFQPAE